MLEHLLSLIVFLPAAVAAILLFVPEAHKNIFRYAAAGVSAVQLTLTALVLSLPYHDNGFRAEEYADWFTLSSGGSVIFRAGYHLAVDGLSLPLLLMSALVMLIAAVASWKEERMTKGYFLLFLILNTSVMGTFCALDMFLFFVFFEFMLIPMYFLVGIWGGERRSYAAVKFFLFTLLGSIFILTAILVISSSSGSGLDYFAIKNLQTTSEGSVLHPQSAAILWGLSIRMWVFLLLFTGFAIKIPAVPLHTWLPDAHVEAPTAVSVILAAILLKTGGYGMIRYTSEVMTPEWVSSSQIIGIVAVISIVYGGLNALAAGDLKRMVAWSSISHMGFVVLGAASNTHGGMQGAIYQMTSHGLVSAMLFLLAGVLQDRTGDREIGHYSGLGYKMPQYTTAVMIAFFAAMGIPGFSPFIGEILVLMGAFKSADIIVTLPILSTLGILLSAGYLLWTVSRMFFGPFYSRSAGELTDLRTREWLILLPLGILIIILGVWPAPLLELSEKFAQQWEELTRTVR